MPTLLFRIIFLLFAGVAVHSSMPVTAVERAIAPAGGVVTVEPDTPRAGEAAQLHVQLNRPGGMSIILKLEITYADGVTQQVVGSTSGSAATLYWETPATAAAGPAVFRLTMSDCGCGDRSMSIQNVLPHGKVEGEFVVVQ